MNVACLSRRVLLAALITSPLPALACHEVVVMMGKGLATQAYIAPNPADVLILWTDASRDREYAALELAGHRLMLVTSVEELAAELATNDYDIVVTPLGLIDAVTQAAAEHSARLVPIVSRDMRRSPEIRDRFAQYLVEDAGVARFLTVINRALSS